MEEHMIGIEAIYRRFKNISLITVIVLLLFSGCSDSKKEMSAYVLTPTQQKLYLNLSKEDTDEIKGIIDLFTSNNKECDPVTGGIPFYVEYDNLTYMITASVISIRKDNEWKTYESKITSDETVDYTLAIVRICQKTYPGMLLDVMETFGEAVEIKTGEITVSSAGSEGAALIRELYSSLYDSYQHPEGNNETKDWQAQIVFKDLAGEHILLLSDNMVKIGDDIYSADFSSIIQRLHHLDESSAN